MESRASIPVSEPHKDPTTSYWQDPPSDIASERSTANLPSTADYVIVGSGISGACIAYNLLSQRPGASVVMLEARTACSGATGRNGGHTKAASYRSFVTNAENLGVDEAIKIAKLERSNIEATHNFAREAAIDCDSHPCTTVDIIYDKTQWDAGLNSIKYMRNVLGDAADRGTDVYKVLNAHETEEKLLCPGAVGAFEYEAGSISAYRFAVGVLKLSLRQGLNLQTNTLVINVEEATAAGHGWTVETTRGKIHTSHVILATNGYTANILSQFQGVIVPLRGQISAQRPGLSLPDSGSLPNTYSFIYEGGYEYMIPRPPDSKFAGDIVIGGGWSRALPDGGAQEFGVTDDSVTDAAVSGYLTNCTVDYFGLHNWGADHPDGRIRKEWTGIMGTSADGLPYVGAVPGASGLWVSASFNGHGMVLCLKSAEALTSMVLGNDEADQLESWFPNSFRITQARLEKAFEGRRDVHVPAETLENRSHI